MSTPSFSASLRAPAEGRTWKPTMTALEAAARVTSVLRDLTHALVDDVDGDGLGGETNEGVGEGLYRTVHVALDDNVEFLVVAELQAAADLVEREHLGGTEVLFALKLQTLVGDFAGFLLGLHDVELVAGLGCAVEAENGGGVCGGHFLDANAALIEEGFDASGVGTGHDDVALAQGTVGNEDGGDVAATFVERTLDDGADGTTLRVGFELEEVGFEEHFLEEFEHAFALLGGDVLRLVFTAPFFDEEVHRSEGALDGVGVGAGLIDLVDGEDDGNARSHGVVDGFLGLGHHIVVGGNDDNGDVGDLCTASTHGGERFVTGGVEEGDGAAIFEADIVGTDVLCDTTGLTGDDIGVANVVEQGGFTVVDVTHDGDDGSAGFEIFVAVDFFDDRFLHFCADKLGAEAKFVGHHLNGLLVEALVDRNHDADAHAGADDLRNGDIHHRGELVGGHKLGEFEHAALGIAAHEVFFVALAGGFALLLAVFRALALAGALRLQTCEVSFTCFATSSSLTGCAGALPFLPFLP